MSYTLEINGLGKAYKHKPILANVDLQLQEGEKVAVVGPSGIGKTTLLKIVAGLIKPDQGTVNFKVNGQRCDQRLGNIGYMPQRESLLPWCTALDNVALAETLTGTKRSAARDAAKKLLTELNLQDSMDLLPSQLSGGMKQRIALARTLLANQQLILLDEPFAAVDALTRRTLRSWLLDVLSKHQRSLLLVTHDLEEALLLTDTVYLLNDSPAKLTYGLSVELPSPRNCDLIETEQFQSQKRLLLKQLTSDRALAES